MCLQKNLSSDKNIEMKVCCCYYHYSVLYRDTPRLVLFNVHCEDDFLTDNFGSTSALTGCIMFVMLTFFNESAA